MKRVCNGVVFAMVLASAVAGSAQSGSTSVQQTQVAQSAPQTTTMKGVIKTIGDTSIVLTPSANKKVDVTFELTAAAKRTGALAAGDTVSVTYYYENGARVVTSLAGKEAK